ncbi:hypothetical protein HPB52_003112 [Rhipicephalus sanguineus]|uniref:Uncharacterized protein n=1 Tax=Rhipicephalus sanguineus TaxID=34632 RepID=A0A9D4QFZ2_RHISA|nr:hypothetical protein HPB52_003112 [Rhipicephalus sanguineus]
MAAQVSASNVANEKKKPASGVAGLLGPEPSSVGKPVVVPPTNEYVMNPTAVDRPEVSEPLLAKAYVVGSAPDQPTTHAPPFTEPESTATPERSFDLTCLFLASILAFSVLAFLFLVYRFFYPSATVAGLRSCGDAVVWGLGSLKEQYETCTEGRCGSSLCGPENQMTCEAEVPWLKNKCECCDWCLRKTLGLKKSLAQIIDSPQ